MAHDAVSSRVTKLAAARYPARKTGRLEVLETALAYALFTSPPMAFLLGTILFFVRRPLANWLREEPWTLRALAVLTLAGLAGAVWSPAPVQSFEGIVAMALLIWFWGIGRFAVAAPRRLWVHLQRAAGIVGLFALVVALTGSAFRLKFGPLWLTFWGPEDKGTVLGLGGNGLGPLLTFGGILALGRLHSAASTVERIEALLTATVALAGPLALGVRNTVWGALAGAIMLLPISGPLTMILVGATAGGVAALKPDLGSRLLSLTRLETERVRWGVWQAALDMIRDHPWLGVGPYQFARLHSLYARPESSHLSDPHSIYLRVASEWGLPAALVFFAWCFSWIPRLWSLRREVWRWSLVAAWVSFLAMGMFDTPLFTFHISGTVFVGLGLASNPTLEGEQTHR